MRAVVLWFLVLISSFSFAQSQKDTSTVIHLNKSGFDVRLTNPKQTIAFANKALAIAKEIDFTNGMAEAYRIRGIGQNYLNRTDLAIKDYQNSLDLFLKTGEELGQAKVYNNIGILYMEINYSKSLEYYSEALKIAKRNNLIPLVASLYGNIGNIKRRQKKYDEALVNYKSSARLFEQLDKEIGLIQTQQNIGVLYFNMGKDKEAESYLIKAIEGAKKNELNSTIASTNLTLASIYITRNDFEKAQTAIKEGSYYADLVNDSKIEFDYLYTKYELENKRQDYKKALEYLRQVYVTDSLNYKNDNSQKLTLIEQQFKFLQKQKENELTIARQRYSTALIWGTTIAIILALIVIVLLIGNVKRKEKSNKKLTALNLEVSRQKENLDKINHHLEEIIDDRTRDLQIKNKKLSEYSSHLSHQIRGPVATMKGLLLLEQDDLIEDADLINELSKCVTEIDDKIIHINEDLNDASIAKLTSR